VLGYPFRYLVLVLRTKPTYSGCSGQRTLLRDGHKRRALCPGLSEALTRIPGWCFPGDRFYGAMAEEVRSHFGPMPRTGRPDYNTCCAAESISHPGWDARMIAARPGGRAHELYGSRAQKAAPHHLHSTWFNA